MTTVKSMDENRCSDAEPGLSSAPSVARLSLRDVATRIHRHLDRFASDPKIAEREWTDGTGRARSLTLYWHPIAYRGGSRIMIRYVNYQFQSSLTRGEAERYLAWLDAGNIGRHHDVPQPERSPVETPQPNTDEIKD